MDRGGWPLTTLEYDAWTIDALHHVDAPPEHVRAVSDRWRPLAERLASLPMEARGDAFRSALAALPRDEAEAFEAVMDRNPSDGPPPIPTGPTPSDPADAWGPLRLWEPPKAEAFPLDVLPPTLAAFCREAAASRCAPVDFVGGAMLAVAGAAIGQSVNVRLKAGWFEPPLLYLALVGEPGTAKTPAIRAAQRPLAEIDVRLRAETTRERERWAEAKRAHDRDDTAPPPGPEPPQLRAIVKDITRESLCVVLQDNPRGVLASPDELTAWIGGFNQYRGGKGTDGQFWLSIYTGDAVGVDRKGGRESIHVPHPFAAVLGGLQPDLLASLTRGRDGDDGFLDRITFVYPDAHPTRTFGAPTADARAVDDWAEVVRRLREVDMRPGEVDADGNEGPPRPWVARLTPEAEALYASWHDAQGVAMEAPDNAGRRGAMAKGLALCGRLALILSRTRLACDPFQALVDANGVPPVEAPDVAGAIRLAAYLANHRERAVGRMDRGKAEADAADVLAWIARNRPAEFRAADVAADLRRFRDDPEALARALAALEAQRAIRPKAEPPPPNGDVKRGRKPSQAYEVHPDLR